MSYSAWPSSMRPSPAGAVQADSSVETSGKLWSGAGFAAAAEASVPHDLETICLKCPGKGIPRGTQPRGNSPKTLADFCATRRSNAAPADSAEKVSLGAAGIALCVVSIRHLFFFFFLLL